MAEVFTGENSQTANYGVPAPILQGGYIPNIDAPTVKSAFGTLIPWCFGNAYRRFTDDVNSLINEGQANLGISAAGVTLATTVPQELHYHFEGLVGPPGPPGPIGPAGMPVILPLGIVDFPKRVIDDGITPGTPAGLSATAMIQAALLEWTANSETDIDHYEVWRHTANNSAAASKIGDVYQTLMVDGGLTGSQIYYYWIKAVDHLLNTSGFSASASATPTDVESADIVEIAADKVLISGAVYLSNWRHGTDVTKIDGGDIYASTITATQINALAVTTEKLNDSAVITQKVLDEAISTMAYSTITGSSVILYKGAAGTTWSTAASVAVTTTGRPIQIQAACAVTGTTGAAMLNVRIRRDSGASAVTIYDATRWYVTFQESEIATITVVDDPAVEGEHTYYFLLQADEAGDDQDATCAYRFISVTELRK